MKKLILSAVVLAAFGLSANAQEGEKSFGFNQGDILVEGSYSLNASKYSPEKGDDVKGTSYNFTPKVGYFLNDKFAVGVELGFGKTNENIFDLSNFGGHVNTTNAGVFGRYYFLELGKRFKTYAEVGLGYAGAKATLGSVDVKGNGMYAGLTAGMNYFVTEKIAIGFGLGTVLGYNSQSVKVGDTKIGTTSNTQVNLNVFNNFFDNAAFSLTYKF